MLDAVAFKHLEVLPSGQPQRSIADGAASTPDTARADLTSYVLECMSIHSYLRFLILDGKHEQAKSAGKRLDHCIADEGRKQPAFDALSHVRL